MCVCVEYYKILPKTELTEHHALALIDIIASAIRASAIYYKYITIITRKSVHRDAGLQM